MWKSLACMLCMGLVVACAQPSSDTDTDTDLGSDTAELQGSPILEDWWDESRNCWDRRVVQRPEEYWGAQWTEGDPECYVQLDYDPCYDENQVPYVVEGDEFCPPWWVSHASEDGRCTRWPARSRDAESGCAVSDPWVQSCDAVDGCCDFQRANVGPECG